MDPVTGIGLAGSIIVKSAPTDIEEFKRSLREFGRFLKDLNDRIEKNPHLISLVKIHSEDGLLERCSRELENLRSKLDKSGKPANFTWPLKAKEVSQSVIRLEGYKNSLLLALGLDHLSMTQDMNLALQSELVEQAAWRRNETARRHQEEGLHIGNNSNKSFGWLYAGPTGKKHLEISEKRRLGTGGWFLSSPEFEGFIEEKPNTLLLWAYGIPGAGKTYISSLVIDYLKARNSTEWGVAYVYFDYKDQQQFKPSLVLASLIKQLASQVPQIPSEIEDLHDTIKKEERGAALEELYMVLLVVLASFSRVFLVFDALDECEPEDQQKLLLLFERMRKDGFNIFLTSRPHPGNIRLSLAHAEKIKISAREEDIRLYITERLGEHPQAKLLFQKAQCDDLASDIMACAQGMFLLVHFYIEDLIQQTSAGQIKTKLEELKNATIEQGPQAGPLDSVYRQAMKTICSQSESRKNLAMKVLSWLIKAKRTLNFNEIQHAVSIKYEKHKIEDLDLPDRMMLLDVCAGLVTIDENTNSVRLVHYTALQFLLKDSALIDTADFNLAMACITYLSFDVFAQGACTSREDYQSRIQSYPFLPYVVEYLSFHLRACGTRLSADKVLKFLESPGNIDSFQQVRGCDGYFHRRHQQRIAPLHIASIVGHCTAAEVLLKKGSDPWAMDSDGRTALHYAAEHGHEAVARALMQKGRERGGRAVARLLTASGVYNGMLRRAIGEACRVVARVSGSYILVRDKRERTAFQLAMQGRHESVVRLLIPEGASFSAKGLWGNREMSGAELGEEVQVLIAAGVDMSVQGKDGKTALHVAASRGSLEAVQQLIAVGVDMSVQDKYGNTALHEALSGCRPKWEVARLLIAAGADVSAKDKSGRTVLHNAALGGNSKMVQQLIAAGADISARDIYGGTTLHNALSKREWKIVELLIAAGADIKGRGKSGITFRWVASRRGGETQQLAAAGADIPVRGGDGKTFLHDAVSESSKDVVGQLIIAGADISVPDKNGRTVLHDALLNQKWDIARLLIEAGADVSAQDKSGRSILHDAALRWYSELIQQLIAAGADVSVQDKGGRTLLHDAALGGDSKVVQQLIAVGADVSAQDKSGRTVLHDAALGGHLEVAQQLIAAGADVSALDKSARTVLHDAALGWNSEVIQQLIAAGADVTVRDRNGKTAIGIAKDRRNIKKAETVKEALQSLV